MSTHNIVRDIEVPFFPTEGTIIADGDRLYDIRRPAFHPEDWDEAEKTIVVRVDLISIEPDEEQAHLDDGWELD